MSTVDNLTVPTRSTLARQVADELSKAIRSGDLKAGARLTETELATRLKTSRGPIREALRLLADSGLVETSPHRGTFVAQPQVDDLAGSCVMRATIEGMAARIVASRQSSVDFSALEALVARMRRARPEELRALDWAFHEAMCKAAANPDLLKCWDMMRNRIGVVMVGAHSLYADAAALAKSHEEILHALRATSPDEAEQFVRRRLMKAGYAWLGRDIEPGLLDNQRLSP